MLVISSALNIIRQSFSAKPIEIHDVYLGNQLTEDSSTIHLVNYYWPIDFFTYIGKMSQSYIPLGILRSGIVRSGQGEIEQVSFTVDDVNRAITLYAKNRSFVGKRVVTRLIFRNALDSADNARTIFDGKIANIKFNQGDKSRKVVIVASPKLGSLQYKTGWPYSIQCNALFGDKYCKQDLNSEKNSASGIITSATKGTVTDINILTQSDDYWNLGYIKFLSGENIDEVRAILDFDSATNTLVLDYELPSAPEPGNAYQVFRGCDYTIETCENVFDNAINFHGYHTIPLQDYDA